MQPEDKLLKPQSRYKQQRKQIHPADAGQKSEPGIGGVLFAAGYAPVIYRVANVIDNTLNIRYK